MANKKKRKLTQEKVDAINRKRDVVHDPDSCYDWNCTNSRLILDRDGRTIEVINCRKRT